MGDNTISKGESLMAEIRAMLQIIPKDFRVHICESGGPENEVASLAVSIAKMAKALERVPNSDVCVIHAWPYDPKPGVSRCMNCGTLFRE